MPKIETLAKFYEEEIRDVYNAEGQLVKALPKMVKAATNQDLKTAFENHLEETENQVERLEKVFKSLGIAVRGKTCVAMQGLIEEAKEVLEEEDIEPMVLDAALIACAQKVEHYEIATYGTLVTWAKQLSYDDQVELLQTTLDEEKGADEKLTEIAESTVNEMAENH
jgi:ferritin-like metal-binding protein YciE